MSGGMQPRAHASLGFRVLEFRVRLPWTHPLLGSITCFASTACPPACSPASPTPYTINPMHLTDEISCVQAVELMTRAADIPPREKELIMGVPEMEVINVMVGSVKISMPGLQKIKNQARSQKKKNKASS